MATATFAVASSFQRVKMIEEALETVLDRGEEMSVAGFGSEQGLHVWVWAGAYSGHRIGISLYDLACELEALL